MWKGDEVKSAAVNSIDHPDVQAEETIADPSQATTADKTVLHIRVDHREAPSGISDHLRQSTRVTIKFEQLAFGDYWLAHHLIVERKTMRDLAASIIDGRLFRQANALAQRPEHVVYVVEGEHWAETGTELSRESFQGALITLSLIYGFPVLHSSGPEESARLMLYACRQLAHRESGRVQIGRKPKRKGTRQLHILQALPGVGPERAKLLLERFATVEKVMQASETDLQSVLGLGPKTAAAIRAVLE